jgi:hypothetical protein
MEDEMTGIFIFGICAALAFVYLIFWLGMKFGGRVLGGELRAVNSHVAELTRLLDTARTAYADAKKDRDDLLAKYDGACAEVFNLTNERDTLRAGLDGWAAQCDDARAVNTQLRKERDELSRKLDKAIANARKHKVGVKRIFPWLAVALLFTLSFIATAQTGYSPARNLEVQDVAALHAATRSIDFAAFSLTDQAVVDELAARAKAGVAIRIYLDRGELQAECRGDITCSRIPLKELIGLAGVEIRVKRSKILMHLKSYQVDGGLVRDGSANFSEQGESKQDNSAVFSTDPAAELAFRSDFETMWNRPTNLTVAEAIKAN